MIRAFVENGRLLVLMIAVIIVAGFAALSTLPRAEDPYITGRTGMVITPFPGASAERVEALVTEKLENRLRELDELEHITSSSRAGLSFIVLDLKDIYNEKDAELIWSRARDLMGEAALSLPEGVGKPRLDEKRSHAYTALFSIHWLGPGSSSDSSSDSEPHMDILGRYAEEMESRLRGVSGTDLVGLFGVPTEEVLVSVDSHRLADLGLTPAEFGRAVAAADAKVAAGQLVNEHTRVSVELSGELTDIERVRHVPLKTDADGNVVRVGDVATVKRQEKMPANDLAIINGERAVVVAARMVNGVRVDKWTASVQQKVETFKQQLPANIKVDVLFNQNEYTNARLSQLISNIAIGFTLIVLVLLFTLGWRSALIVASSLPLTVLMTLSIMKYYGLPIHQMSMTGLVVALGIMVDNAIVMVDTIAYERSQGRNRVDAVLKAVKHLWLPLLGSTLTTVLAFMPIVLMPGAAGEFVGGIALAVIFSLIGSYIISHTLVAGLAGRFLPERSDRKGRAWWRNGVNFPRLSALFERSMIWALRHPWGTLAGVATVPFLGFMVAGQLTEQFFPASDRDMFQIELFMPGSTSIDATHRLTYDVSEVVKQQEGLETIHWFVGRSAPSFYYNLMQNRDGSPNYAQAMVSARHFDDANRMIPELQKILDDQFPQAQILVRKLEQGPPYNAPVEIRIYGPNVDKLKMLGDELRRVMSEIDDVVHTRTSLGSTVPKLWLTVREEESQRSGLALRALSGQLQNALDGVVSGSLLESTQELPVRIRLASDNRADVADLSSLEFVSPQTSSNERGVPLASLGQLEYRSSRGVIARRNGERVNTIEGYVRDGVLPAVVVGKIQALIAKDGLPMPAGYRLEVGGEDEKRDDAVGQLMASVGVVVILLIVVVVLSFNSFRISSIIFLVAFLSFGLGLLNVYLFDHAFGFVVIVGLLGLLGLAINAAIVILAELKADPNAVRGDESDVMAAVQRCTRHITSTTITTVGGFLPLILGGGGFWPPFAIAIAGGTVMATLLSFYLVPAVFLLFARKRHFEQTLELKTA